MWGCILLAGGVAAQLFLIPSPGEKRLSWQPYSRAALLAATRAGRPVVVDFRAAWCLPCLQMDRTTFLGAAVQEFARGFVLLRADVTDMSRTEPEWLAEHRVSALPTLLFFDATGHEVQRSVGYVSRDTFVKTLERLDHPETKEARATSRADRQPTPRSNAADGRQGATN